MTVLENLWAHALIVAWCFVSSAPASAQGMAAVNVEGRASPLAVTDREVPAVHFEDVAAKAGLAFHHVAADPAHKKYILEVTGSGVGILDYDNDGLQDIFLISQTRWEIPEGQAAPTNRLFRNRGDLRFEDVTEQAGLVRAGWGQGVCVGDYDNDGFDDLFVTYYGHNVLYRNHRNGTFADVTQRAGLPAGGRRWGSGCAFLDYDRDGHLDLAVANYVDFDPGNTPQPGENELCEYQGKAVVCGPRGLPGESNLLYHNEGDGTFRDVTEASGLSEPAGYYGLSVLTGDFDSDGWTDIYVACDSTPSLLYRNNHDGTFAEIGYESGTALNEHGQEQGGMGVDAADYNRDGWLDIIKTNFDNDVPSLYKNEGEGFFSDVTFHAGLGVHTRFVGWGVGFVDVDHDGWKDVLMVNGHVYGAARKSEAENRFLQPRNLFWNLGNGGFLDISEQAGPGIAERTAARGAAFGDLDNDGDIDVVINNLDGPPSLLASRGKKQNWIVVETRGASSNRNGIGARVHVRTGDVVQIREVRSGGSFLSQSDLRLHFGLGTARRVDEIEVRWPSGLLETFPGGDANRHVRLDEGKGTLRASRLPAVGGSTATQ